MAQVGLNVWNDSDGEGLGRRRGEQTRQQIALNLQMVRDMKDGQDCEVEVDLLEKAPLHRFNLKEQVKSVNSSKDLIEVLSQAGEAKWVGIDIEHSKGRAYYGLVCLIQLTLYD